MLNYKQKLIPLFVIFVFLISFSTFTTAEVFDSYTYNLENPNQTKFDNRQVNFYFTNLETDTDYRIQRKNDDGDYELVEEFTTDMQGKASPHITINPESNEVRQGDSGWLYYLQKEDSYSASNWKFIPVLYGYQFDELETFDGTTGDYIFNLSGVNYNRNDENLELWGVGDATFKEDISPNQLLWMNLTLKEGSSGDRSIIIEDTAGNQLISKRFVYENYADTEVKAFINQTTNQLELHSHFVTSNVETVNYNESFTVKFRLGHQTSIPERDSVMINSVSVIPLKSEHLFKNPYTLGREGGNKRLWNDFNCLGCLNTDIRFNDGSGWVSQFNEVNSYSDTLELKTSSTSIIHSDHRLQFETSLKEIYAYNLNVDLFGEVNTLYQQECSLDKLGYDQSKWTFDYHIWSVGDHWNTGTQSNVSIGTNQLSDLDDIDQCTFFFRSKSESADKTNIDKASNFYYYNEKFFKEGCSLTLVLQKDYINRFGGLTKHKENSNYYGGLFIIPLDYSDGVIYFIEPHTDRNGVTEGYITNNGYPFLVHSHDDVFSSNINNLNIEIKYANNQIVISSEGDSYEITRDIIYVPFKQNTLSDGYRLGFGITGTNKGTTDHQEYKLSSSKLSGTLNSIPSTKFKLNVINQDAERVNADIQWATSNPQDLKDSNIGSDGLKVWSLDTDGVPIQETGNYSFTVQHENYTQVFCQEDAGDCFLKFREKDKGTTIERTVTLSNASNLHVTVRRSDGVPVENAEVRARTEENGTIYEYTESTNEDGVVFLTQIKSGDYNITISKDGYITTEDSLTVKNTIYKDYELKHHGSIKIGVNNEQNFPIKNARVRVGNKIKYTDENGEIDNVMLDKSGTFNITISAEGFETIENKEISVLQNQIKYKEITLDYLGSINISKPEYASTIKSLPYEFQGIYNMPQEADINIYLNGDSVSNFQVFSGSGKWSFTDSKHIKKGTNRMWIEVNTSNSYFEFYKDDLYKFNSEVYHSATIQRTKPLRDTYIGHSFTNPITFEGFGYFGVDGQIELLVDTPTEEEEFKVIESKNVDKGYGFIRKKYKVEYNSSDFTRWYLRFRSSQDVLSNSSIGYINYDRTENYASDKIVQNSCYFDFPSAKFTGSDNENSVNMTNCLFNFQPRKNKQIDSVPFTTWWGYDITSPDNWTGYKYIIYVDGKPIATEISDKAGRSEGKYVVRKIESGKHTWHVDFIDPYYTVYSSEPSTFNLGKGFSDVYADESKLVSSDLLKKYVDTAEKWYSDVKNVMPMEFRIMIAMIIMLGTAVAVASRTHWELGLSSMMVETGMFAVLGWLPLWLALSLVVISGFIVVRTVVKSFVTQ